MYDAAKDKILKFFEMDQGNGRYFQVSIMIYNGGVPKLQMGRRFQKKDGSFGYANAGRLTVEEVEWMSSHFAEITNEMKRSQQPKQESKSTRRTQNQNLTDDLMSMTSQHF